MQFISPQVLAKTRSQILAKTRPKATAEGSRTDGMARRDGNTCTCAGAQTRRFSHPVNAIARGETFGGRPQVPTGHAEHMQIMSF